MSQQASAELARNRRALHNYEIVDKYEAGIILQGTEIKSLRARQVSIQEAYVLIDKQGRAILKGCHIAPYRFGSRDNHLEKRDRILLLHKQQLIKLHACLQQKRLTLIPLAIYLKKGFAKVQIAVARGKQAHDKRSDLKKKEQLREIERGLKKGAAFRARSAFQVPIDRQSAHVLFFFA